MTSANQNEACQDEDFKDKWGMIQDRYSYFWKQPSAVADVEAYLYENQHHQYVPTHEWPEKWIRGNSHFQKNNLNRGEILAQNDRAVILGNRSSFDAAQYPNEPGRAGMSFIHVLGLPKQQIFNGVSLTQDNCGIIDDIISLFETSWGNSNRGNEFRDRVIEYQMKMFGRQDARVRAQRAQDGDQSSLEYQSPAKYPDELSYKALDLEAKDFNYGLHLWPEQSVGHLHIHIIARPMEMRQYSTFAHDHKTVDARDVRKFISKRGPEYYVPAYRTYQDIQEVPRYYGPALDVCGEVGEEDEDEDPGYHEPVYDETQQALYQSSHQPS